MSRRGDEENESIKEELITTIIKITPSNATLATIINYYKYMTSLLT